MKKKKQQKQIYSTKVMEEMIETNSFTENIHTNWRNESRKRKKNYLQQRGW